jgi:hypothetical protein
MKDILKNLGIFLIVIGVIILTISVFKETTTNARLITSAILVVVGFFGHILLNKFVD